MAEYEPAGDDANPLPRVRDWTRNRWAWKRSLLRDHRLSDGAKLLAVTLCDTFANHATALCTPGLPALAEALGKSERAIQRALAELRGCGWIVTAEGRGRGRRMAVTFTTGDGEVPFLGEPKVADLCARRAEKATRAAPENTTPAAEKHDRSVTGYYKERTKEDNQYPPTPQATGRRPRRQEAEAQAWVHNRLEELRRELAEAKRQNVEDTASRDGAENAGEDGAAPPPRPAPPRSTPPERAPETPDRAPPLARRLEVLAELGLLRPSGTDHGQRAVA